MGTKNNPGKFDCYAKAHPDEPMFILLGRDPTGPGFADLWALLRKLNDRPDSQEKSVEAKECADQMREWYLKNKGRNMDAGSLILDTICELVERITFTARED